MESTISNQARANKERDNDIGNKKETDTALPEDKGSTGYSEYDSADADSYTDEDENQKIRSRASYLDDNSDGESLLLEREEGDGQESVSSKKIDDDEDKKNPQYIPKRGTFYEHDDRTLEDNEIQNEGETDKEKDNKKKVWQDKKERWAHDRYNEPEQAPKSRSELIAIYGYDIRNEEGPPRARRRRKYGRGPNKYTRNWEDEEAYNKPSPVVKRGKKPLNRNNQEEFPPLIKNSSERNENNHKAPNNVKVDQQPPSMKVETWNEAPKEKQIPHSSKSENSQNNASYPDNNNKGQRIGSGRISSSKEPNESEYNGFTTKSRNARNRKATAQKVLPAKNVQKDDYIQSQNFYLSNKNNELEKDMSKLNIEDGNGSKSNFNKANYNNCNNNQRQSSVPPRLQSEQKGSKRYSSMRQKSLPETTTPPLNNYATTFYPNEFNQQSVPSPTQSILHQSSQILSPTTQVAHVSPLQPTPLPQVPVTAAPLLQAPTFAPQPYAQPPPFIQTPAVAGPTFIPTAPATQLINFVQSQPSFPANFQGYQQPFNSVTPPTELYQPQGGITYYSTDQQIAQRQVPQKRPKAAIPIVAPPSYDKKDENSDVQSVNNTQIENTETTVEVHQ
ncbi:protein CASC3 [Diorhabda carinulata]|uniref:protein CASC3 n=1 Tax=Diorhabda carinulata TaxID=1163345 RepID=UPI00259FE822|nr:protein CASC3 [Diorhabda carinulata]